MAKVELRGKQYQYSALQAFWQTIPPEATSLMQTRKRHEILNTPQYMPVVALAD
jgi:hypothetical protein